MLADFRSDSSASRTSPPFGRAAGAAPGWRSGTIERRSSPASRTRSGSGPSKHASQAGATASRWSRSAPRTHPPRIPSRCIDAQLPAVPPTRPGSPDRDGHRADRGVPQPGASRRRADVRLIRRRFFPGRRRGADRRRAPAGPFLRRRRDERDVTRVHRRTVRCAGHLALRRGRGAPARLLLRGALRLPHQRGSWPCPADHAGRA